MNLPEISVAPPIITYLGPVPLTTTMAATVLASFLLILTGIFVRSRMSLVPGRGQMMIEMVVDFYLNTLKMSMGSEKEARKLVPFIVTVVLFLIFANQLTLLPFVGSITLGEAYLFKTPAAHYSLPIALAVLGIVSAHVVAFFTSPLRHMGNFLKFHLFFKIRSFKDIPMACIEFFLGIMDIIGELAKMVSLSTRLFGNLFAGEVIIGIISGLLFATQFIVPIPFIVLGILSGFVQAFVFSMLLALFMSSTIASVQKD
jgi:F-type H+-transporting ATPase subunit a